MRETRVGSGWGVSIAEPAGRSPSSRRVIAVAPVLSLLAACGGDGDEPTSTPAASGGEPATEAPSNTPEAVASPTDSSEPEATEAPTPAGAGDGDRAVLDRWHIPGHSDAQVRHDNGRERADTHCDAGLQRPGSGLGLRRDAGRLTLLVRR
ncbi:MAG: hypothetical protein M9890_07835 [Thermomicrobiales bacterium]|nr:hypothetical protein [Thermomicrobiales bacterium]